MAPFAGIAHGSGVFVRAWAAHEEQAPTVVLVPGLAASSESVVPTAERLSGRFRVLAPDLPGFGRSDSPPGALSVIQLGDALADWMSVLDLSGSSIVAFSFGCQVALALAARHPDLADRLVLASPTPDPAARTVPAILRRWLAEARTHSPSYRLLLPREYVRTGALRAFRTLRHALADPVERRLAAVHAPVLVLRGTADPLISQQWAQRLTRGLPNARLTVLADVPHAMSFDAPDELVDAVVPFLTAQPSPAHLRAAHHRGVRPGCHPTQNGE